MTSEAREEFARVQRAYRKAAWALIRDFIFVALCCVFALLIRHWLRFPPLLLTTVFIAALCVFGGDIFRFLSYRSQLRRLAAQTSA